MNSKYYAAIRPNTNEIHSIHKEGCPFLPDDEKRIYLGVFNSVREAVSESKLYFSNSGSCPFCCKEAKVSENKQMVLTNTHERPVTNESLHQINHFQTIFCCVN